jgi:pyrimidine-nucleoside phosphorylase
VVGEVGCSIIGQTDRLAPADRKLYALRDVTGTVPSIPLITASIMSKKLAEGAESLVFDVKCGRAAFMRTPDDARALAHSLIRVGRALNRKTAALITAMDQPLGRTAGNAVEVAEAIDTLKGGGPADTRRLTLELTAQMTVLGGLFPNAASALRALETRLDDGRALDVFRRMVTAQGGDARVIDDPSLLPQPGATLSVPAPTTGMVASVDAEQIGRIVLRLGGGRTATTDRIDPAAGIDRLVQTGESVEKGQPLMRLLAKNAALAESLLSDATAAVRLTETPVTPSPLILETLSV